MNVISKIRTAKRVLLKNGFKEVIVLLFRNIELYFTRYFRVICSKLRRIAYRFFLSIQHIQNSDKINILYLTEQMEVENGQTARYRIFNLMEALRGTANTRFEIIENGIYKDKHNIAWADLIILMRVEFSLKIKTLVKIAKQFNIPVVYDIDDIIFLQDYVEKFCSILPNDIAKNIETFKSKFSRQELTLRNADFVTVSTSFIAAIMEDEGKKSYVIHNGLNYRQLKIAEKIAKNDETSKRFIGYLSGSVTHDKDFLQVVPALLKILDEYKNVRLNIVGYLNVDNLPQELVKLTKTACFMKWSKLLKYSSQNYINLSPLDIDNPFCHAKSELKYFESAIVGVPTVASATDTYKRCINHEYNGMLASNTDEWYTSIKALLDNPTLYENIQKNAYKQVLENYSPKAIAKEAMNAYQSILREYNK